MGARDEHERIELELLDGAHRLFGALESLPAAPRPQALLAENEPAGDLERDLQRHGATRRVRASSRGRARPRRSGARSRIAGGPITFQLRLPPPSTIRSRSMTARVDQDGHAVRQPEHGHAADLVTGDLAGDLRWGERRLARAELVADDAVDVEAGRGQHHARGVPRRIGLADRRGSCWRTRRDRTRTRRRRRPCRRAPGRTGRAHTGRPAHRAVGPGRRGSGRQASAAGYRSRDQGRRGVPAPAVSVDRMAVAAMADLAPATGAGASSAAIRCQFAVEPAGVAASPRRSRCRSPRDPRSRPLTILVPSGDQPHPAS